MSNGYQIDGKSTETKHYLIINELIGNKSILGDPDFFNSRSKFFETISKLFALKALEKLEIGSLCFTMILMESIYLTNYRF